MQQIVILNSPSNSGKDTIADEICKRKPRTIKMQFKTELYKETANHFDVPLDTMIELASDRVLKETSSPLFNGKSPRQALIYVSEELIKPVHGNDYFGRKSAESINALSDEYDTFIFSDGGFLEELLAVTYFTKFIKAIDEQVKLIHMYRIGCDFAGDSRNYVVPDFITPYTVSNNATLEDVLLKVEAIIESNH